MRLRSKEKNKNERLFILVYGPDGLGKTTGASHFPNPIALGPEVDGSRFLEGIEADLDSKTFEGLNKSLDDLINDTMGFETLVIDSLDHVESLIHEKIKKDYGVKNIAKAAGGFGAGLKEAAEMQNELAAKISQLKDKMHIYLIAHSQVRTCNDPLTEEPYDRYELKLHESASVSPRAMWRETVEGVFFLNKEKNTSKEGKKVNVKSSKNRYFFTERTDAYDAKCRYLAMPEKVPFKLSENVFDVFFNYAFKKSADLYDECMKLYKSLEKPDENIKKFIEDNKKDNQKLANAKKRLEEICK